MAPVAIFFPRVAILKIAIRLQESAAFTLFVDLKCAFDSVLHDKLWANPANVGLSAKFRNVLKNLNDAT